MNGKKGLNFKLTPALLAAHPEIQEQLDRPIPASSSLAMVPLASKPGSDSPKQPAGREKTLAERTVEAMLEGWRLSGRITKYEYEAVTIKVGEPRCRYTADFACWKPDKTLLLVESKGKKTWEDSLIKFKSAKRQYPEIEFEWWKVERGELTRIL